jgi:hypothetical protein
MDLLNLLDLETLINFAAGAIGGAVFLGLVQLKKLVAKTPTKLDDQLLEAVVKAVKEKL